MRRPPVLTFERIRYRAVWADPARKLRTLESFAETEEDGGKDLEVAARRVADPDLRAHLERHALDERRHAELFRDRAAAVRAAASLETRDALESDRAYDLSRGRKDEVDAHGFFKAGLIDELGEVSYLAMIHVAEQKAARIFAFHHDLVGDDPELEAVFASILKDEKYHVAYTQRFLERWEREGRGREVKEGLRAARSSRFLGAWRRVGLRSGARFSQALLFLLYWTVLAPFGLVARTRRSGQAVVEPAAAPAEESLRSQY